MAKDKQPELVRALTSFRTTSKEMVRGRMIHEGDHVPADDPVVKKLSHLFGPIEEATQHVRTAAVEQATAAPGEVRTVSAPDDLEEYHQGSGWYEIDGEKVRGEEAARELLEKGN